MAERTPRELAVAAAEQLAVEGWLVTVRAVREPAQVNINVASSVTREWNSAKSQYRDVHARTDSVVPQVAAVWPAAVEAAGIEQRAEGDGWLAQLKGAEEERDAALDDATAVRVTLDEARAKVGRMEDLVTKLREAATVAEQEVAAAEIRDVPAVRCAIAVEGVDEGLREALATVSLKPKRSRRRRARG